MTIDDVFAAAGVLGLEIVEAEGGGGPALLGPDCPERSALLRVVGLRRDEVLARVRAGRPRLREWLWRGGHRAAEEAAWGYPGDAHCVGAWWWRFAGERRWRPVPGRNPDGAAPPDGEEVEP